MNSKKKQLPQHRRCQTNLFFKKQTGACLGGKKTHRKSRTQHTTKTNPPRAINPPRHKRKRNTKNSTNGLRERIKPTKPDTATQKARQQKHVKIKRQGFYFLLRKNTTTKTNNTATAANNATITTLTKSKLNKTGEPTSG